MKLRSLVTALISFCLGAGAWAVDTHTSWHNLLEQRTEFHAVDTNDMAWVEGGKGQPTTYSMKFLYRDPNSGQEAMVLRYPAGHVMPPHMHSSGHGMYVLSGKLVTNHGTYGPGSFVWFPANEVVSHGASPDEDVVVIFMRHEDMDIRFVDAAH